MNPLNIIRGNWHFNERPTRRDDETKNRIKRTRCYCHSGVYLTLINFNRFIGMADIHLTASNTLTLGIVSRLSCKRYPLK